MMRFANVGYNGVSYLGWGDDEVESERGEEEVNKIRAT